MAAPNKKPKAKSGGSPRSYSEIYKSSAAGASTAAGETFAPAPVAAVAVAAPVKEVVLTTSDDVDWRGEYGYVIDDLKRLAVVTAIIAGGIIVVGIFI